MYNIMFNCTTYSCRYYEYYNITILLKRINITVCTYTMYTILFCLLTILFVKKAIIRYRYSEKIHCIRI